MARGTIRQIEIFYFIDRLRGVWREGNLDSHIIKTLIIIKNRTCRAVVMRRDKIKDEKSKTWNILCKAQLSVFPQFIISELIFISCLSICEGCAYQLVLPPLSFKLLNSIELIWSEENKTSEGEESEVYGSMCILWLDLMTKALSLSISFSIFRQD